MTRNGFTLLEILVVLAILGMGMALITQMTTVAARHSERVEEDTTVQLACENMMNSILAGNLTATIGVSIPIPDAPNWEITVELLDGPIEKLVAIRITAQRYVTELIPSFTNPNEIFENKIPDEGRRYVLKEWARRSEIKTRVVQTNANGESSAIDGTGETVWNDLNGSLDGLGGSSNLGPGSGLDAPYDPFAALDQELGARSNGSNNAGGTLGGGLNPVF